MASRAVSSATSTPVETGPAMRKELGILGAISLIVGCMIGSGIFVSPGGVLEATGSVGLSLVVWVCAGLIALMGSLCYSELGTMLPKSGGVYTFVREAFGDIAAFIWIWVDLLLVRPSSLAIMALTFGTYFVAVFDLCGNTRLYVRLAAVACLVTVMFLNCYSTKLANWATIISTVFKVAALLVIVCGGILKLAQGNSLALTSGFQGSNYDVTKISLALYDALWAYDGWVCLTTVVEEIQKPSRNLPIANTAGVVLIVIVYLATNIAYFAAMTTTEILEADAVAVVWGDRVLKGASLFIPVAVMVSAFGAVNGNVFSGGRSIFVAARDGNLPSILSYIHVDKLTPLPTMVFTTVTTTVFVLLGDISSLVDFFSFTVWLFYGLSFGSLLVFRVTKPDRVRPYKCPIVIPVVMVIISIYLVLAPIIKEPSIGYLYAALFSVGGLIFYFPFVKYKLDLPYKGGLIFYFPFVKYKLDLPYKDKLTLYIQLILQVVPPTKYMD
ncbi:hypothetical protein RRG08_057909 [Elysia crispata]|uniref:b(0,+)-type amino acid transporter 1 n=1 Tax=Elysia crispata TaxID=231223 RepID=A0AAE1DKA3_9GAST|nr:hypothetical protein RRG08_057909 [Elysia crispata]KAK3773863.1 hypothetical protein RRG08_057909 [Elysia crispata]KAK3773864.1 hypothetical protein RRG08_057909 [Elysia crispata]